MGRKRVGHNLATKQQEEHVHVVRGDQIYLWLIHTVVQQKPTQNNYPPIKKNVLNEGYYKYNQILFLNMSAIP